jgi:zinc protease
MAQMLDRGTLRRPRQAYEDALDQHKAKLDFGGGATAVSAQGQTVRAELAPLLRLAAEALREPAFAATEFDQLKREWRASIDQQRTDPQAIAQRSLSRHDNPWPVNDVRYEPSFDEEDARVAAATLDEVKRFHRSFAGASNAELAIVGDFDVDATKALVAELFGGWASPAAYARVPQPYRPTKPAVLPTETPDKANAMLVGSIAIPLVDTAAEYPALLLANHILGASGESRIPDRLRQKDGLSYAAQTGIDVSPFDDNSALYVYAIFAPENLARVRQGIDEELARVLKDGVSDHEVADAKKAALQKRQLARTDDGVLGSALASQAYLRRDWSVARRVDADLEALTTEQVNAVLRKYLRVDGFAWAYAGDFAKAKR